MLNSKPFMVAELSCNHGGSLENALALVDACADAGADAIKLQCWALERMVVNGTRYIESGPWAGRHLGTLYDQAWTPWEWFPPIFERAKHRGMVGFSSVFDHAALQFLESINCPMYKIASFELVDLPLIKAVAGTDKPMVMSSGMATMDEVLDACESARACSNLMILLCASAYPAVPDEYGLQKMRTLLETGLPIGISDHTKGFGVAVAAAAHGATMIEKHVRLDMVDTLDKEFSATVDELAELVGACRDAVAFRDSTANWGPQPAEMHQLALRRSLHFVLRIPAGTIIEPHHIATARPADGMRPGDLHKVIGKRLAADVTYGMPVTANLLI